MDQGELKAAVGRAAVDLVAATASAESIIGVGTGSTVDAFVDALGRSEVRLGGAVSSSVATTERLRGIGIAVVEPAAAVELDLYVDGADEIDPHGNMIKGGGGALTGEKIVASMARRFVCIVDESKLVDHLGAFGVPVEVIPAAAELVTRRFAAMGGTGRVRSIGGRPFVTDNGQHIVDVAGLEIADPLAFEDETSGWPGVVTVGVFAHQRASVALVGTPEGVRRIDYDVSG